MIVPKIRQVLTRCVSAETAFVQDDYPAKRRHWLEFKPGKSGGFRYVMQTEDSKTKRWNKPKPGTYTWLAILTSTDDAVSVFGLGLNDSEDALEAFMAAFDDQLNSDQRRQADLLKKLIPHYGTKKTDRLFRVLDAETGLELFSNITAGHPVFAATITTSDLPVGLSVEVADLKKYNPPIQYIDEHRRFGLLDSYRLGKRLFVEYTSAEPTMISQIIEGRRNA
jgi:hypothetical protein